jgi:hypothetical protein
MKKSVLLLIVLLLISCKDNSLTEIENSNLDEPFEIRIGQKVSLDEGQLVLLFDSVSSDSRCPEGACCADAGDAVVVIKHNQSSFLFHTNLWPKGITIGTYNIELLSLSPYPKSSQLIQVNAYVAKFIVSRVILG